jgi:DNA-directed RNA polymerase specialized sigma24 family protein
LNDLTADANSLLKGDSARPDGSEKLVSLPQHGTATESLPAQQTTANPTGKQSDRPPAAGSGRFLSDELTFRDVSGPGGNAKHAASVLPQGNRSANKSAMLADKRGNGLLFTRRRQYPSRELDALFSFLAFDVTKGSLSSRLVDGSGLNAGGVDGYFSSAGGGPSNAFLSSGEGGALDAKPMDEFLASFWDALPGLCPSVLHTTRLDEGQGTEGGEGPFVPPLYLSVVLYRPSGKPLDPSAQHGLDRLCAYAWSSIRHAERVHGEKLQSPEDVVQEIYIEWRGLVGPQPEEEALSKLLQDGSEEMKSLRVAVQRVIGRARYQQRQRSKAIDINRPAADSAAFARRGEQERIDWEDLWENVVSTLAPHEKQILELRKQGKTFAEIGSALGLPRQRACETYHNVVARLQKNYPDW